MRLPIVQFPRIVVENFGYFAAVFQTTEQQKHFCEYVTGLIAGDKATITAINALFLNKNDQNRLCVMRWKSKNTGKKVDINLVEAVSSLRNSIIPGGNSNGGSHGIASRKNRDAD